MVAEMKENCGAESARNPLYMPTERKWRWDFQTGALPRLVRLYPKDLKFSPVAEPSPKFAGKFFLQLAAKGSVQAPSAWFQGHPAHSSQPDPDPTQLTWGLGAQGLLSPRIAISQDCNLPGALSAMSDVLHTSHGSLYMACMDPGIHM